MVEIQAYSSSNWAAMFNILAQKWDGWKKIVYDETDTSQVNELWVSDEVYLNRGSSIGVYHSSKGFNSTYPAQQTSATSFIVISSDKGIMVLIGTSTDLTTKMALGISKTINADGSESGGIVHSSSNTVTLYTDNMSATTAVTTSNFVSNSPNNTQVVPICSNTCADKFNGLGWTFMRKATDGGKAKFPGGECYVVGGVISLAFTEE